MEIIPNTYFRMHMFRESEKKYFFKTYLEEKKRLRGNEALVTEAEIETLVDVAKPMEMVSGIKSILSYIKLYKQI